MNWHDRPTLIQDQKGWEQACNEIAEILREPVPFPYRGICYRDLITLLQIARWRVERLPEETVCP